MFVSNSGRWKDHQIRRWSNQSHGSDICHTRWVLPLKRRWLGHWHCWKARCFPTPCRVLAISSICFRRHQRFQKDAMLRCYSQRRGSKVKWYGIKKQGKWGKVQVPLGNVEKGITFYRQKSTRPLKCWMALQHSWREWQLGDLISRNAKKTGAMHSVKSWSIKIQKRRSKERKGEPASSW